MISQHFMFSKKSSKSGHKRQIWNTKCKVHFTTSLYRTGILVLFHGKMHFMLKYFTVKNSHSFH